LNLAKLKQIAKTSAVLGQHLPNSCARTVRAIISGELPPEGRERSTRCRPNTTRRLSEYVAQGPDNSVSIFCLSNSRPRWMIRGVSTRMLAVRGRPPGSAAGISGSKRAHPSCRSDNARRRCRMPTTKGWPAGARGVDVYEVRKLKTLKTENSARLPLTLQFEVRSSSTQVGTASLASPYRRSSNFSALSDGSKLISQVRMPSARASDTNPAAG
jgi:hypothetical protein